MSVRDVDVEYTVDDPDDGWFGSAQTVHRQERDVAPIADDTADTDSWRVASADPGSESASESTWQHTGHTEPTDNPPAMPVAAAFEIVPTRRSGFVAAPSRGSWESRLAGSGAWDFKVAPSDPWYRSKAGLVVAIIAVALAAVAVVLFLRAPAPAVDQPTNVVPSESNPAPVPSNPAPVPSIQVPAPPPPPPPGPPPPPAPSAEEMSPPVVDRQYAPSYQTPDAPKKPQTNVTRAPMSATPPPPPKETDRGRATPGDSGTHGLFG